MEYSELPWTYFYSGSGGHDIISSDDVDVATCQSGWALNGADDHFEKAKANAAFIVKACNEYYPMLKVIKALIEKLDNDVWMLELSKNEVICTESIKQIIKEAE